ncbi:hypothetical protein Hanom_Chr17g01526091 [Helianthus anomalus]
MLELQKRVKQSKAIEQKKLHSSALIPNIRTLCMFGNLATTSTKTATVLKNSIGFW